MSDRTQPEDCPKSPVSDPRPCAMSSVETGASLVSRINQCTRCGWVDPASLDAYAELGYKRKLTASQSRTAMAIEGEPFTFVRSSEADITLDEALGQALGAASMCWQYPERAGIFDDQRAARIMDQLKKLLAEKARDERRALAEEIGRNFH
jgi:hypothetical protein